jgi:two-component system, NtrC family, sensor kinase
MARPSKTSGKTSAAKTRKASSPKDRKPGKTKRRIAPTAIRSKHSSVSGLGKELKEAREQQAATAEILKVIASSPGDVQPVFEAIAESAKRLLGSYHAVVTRVIDDTVHLAAFTSGGEEGDKALQRRFPMPLSGPGPNSRAARTGEIELVTDTETYLDNSEDIKKAARARGFRSVLVVPMLRNGVAIGTIATSRRQPGSFAEKEIDLLRTFADQAVIAIENTRLFNETQQALGRQTATSDVLKVIASSPSNLQPVYDAIAERSKALIGAHSTVVVRYTDGMIELASFTLVSPEADAAVRKMFPRRPFTGDPQNEQILRGEIARISDAETELQGNVMRDVARARGWRSRLQVPLKDDTGVVGWISITRKEPGGFADKDVELLRTFANQAVIAIQNVKLFEEVQARTRDLQESLQQQTATADVLKVIASSPTEVGPVLQAIVESACQLCESDDATVALKDGHDLVFKAQHGSIPIVWDRIPINRQMVTGRAVIDGQPVHVRDLYGPEGEGFPDAREFARQTDVRTVLSVPLLRESESIGVITLRRTEVEPFSDKQINLLQTFADQAVIAIGNVRLFDEVQARTRELSQSLDDLRTAQDRLIQTEKLASLGQLTAGIAHEIKNPLNFVNNFAALSVELTDELKGALKPAVLDQTIRAEVDEITGLLKDNLGKVVQHGKRADSIVKNMLLHSREGSGERRSADINALVGESLNLAYHGARAEKPGFTITLKHDLDPNAGALELYPQEITRALLNLISNGFYAATRRKDEADDDTFEPVLSATTRDLGETVEIRIRDNGTGISPEVRAKMFNPFFTTKPTGEGTGLGLSITHDIIVKQHGGSIDVDTEPGAFAEFIITLPRDSGTVASEK